LDARAFFCLMLVYADNPSTVVPSTHDRYFLDNVA
jgi:ATPase subunit of ABC transporter with duplicated ATPase domains